MSYKDDWIVKGEGYKGWEVGARFDPHPPIINTLTKTDFDL